MDYPFFKITNFSQLFTLIKLTLANEQRDIRLVTYVYFRITTGQLQSKYIKRALVNPKFQLDNESFDLKLQLYFGASNENINFLINLQTSILKISASLMLSGHKKVIGAFL